MVIGVLTLDAIFRRERLNVCLTYSQKATAGMYMGRQEDQTAMSDISLY
jgi:hypothetical protein